MKLVDLDRPWDIARGGHVWLGKYQGIQLLGQIRDALTDNITRFGVQIGTFGIRLERLLL
jgi:hypothetical protein